MGKVEIVECGGGMCGRERKRIKVEVMKIVVMKGGWSCRKVGV